MIPGRWAARVRPLPDMIEVKVFCPESDLLRAKLPWPKHPRALATVLEGLALWQGKILHTVMCVDESSESYGLTGLGIRDSLDDPRSPLLHVTEAGPAKLWFRKKRPRPQTIPQLRKQLSMWSLDVDVDEKEPR